jgi:predicted O-methyltransferase YrrM
MKLINSLRRFFHNTSQTRQMAEEIREGIANQTHLLNRKLTEVINLLKAQSVAAQFNSPSGNLDINNGYQAPPSGASGSSEITDVMEALRSHPLLFAPNTFNTNHPDYNPAEARNFPGKIFNMNAKTDNPVYGELKKLIQNNEIAEARWANILSESLAEAKTVPHADEVFQRKDFIEKYMKDLSAKYQAFYQPGWVNLDDALFLYWVVRKMKPKVIVQTGVCNGLSSAFMMLALAKNGPDGTLHVIDMPPVFDSKSDDWKAKGKVYGVVIPEGKTSGWIVPDAYRNRFEVLNGDAKDLLPGLLAKLGKVDMFYHDSDHTYDHMMFEFREAKKYLTKHGIMVSDDISWNASLWDFADDYAAPAYNYRGSMGIACF